MTEWIFTCNKCGRDELVDKRANVIDTYGCKQCGGTMIKDEVKSRGYAQGRIKFIPAKEINRIIGGNGNLY